MTLYRRLGAVLAAALTIAAAGLLSAAPATAAPAKDRATVRLTVSSVAGDARSADLQQVITCTLTVHNPHKSSHVPGTIEVTSQVQCTAPVAKIVQKLGLYRTHLVGWNSDSNTGVAVHKIKTTAPCLNGSYDALGLATVYFPPGYNPPSGSLGAWSPAVSIVC